MSFCLPSSVLPLLLHRFCALFFPTPIVLPLPLRVCVRVSQLSAHFFFTAALFIFVPAFSTKRVQIHRRCAFSEVVCAFERWLTSQTRLRHNDLRTWQAYIPLMILHYGTMQAGWWVKLTSLTERQHIYSHRCAYIMKSVPNPKTKQTASGVSPLSHLRSPCFSVISLHVWMYECMHVFVYISLRACSSSRSLRRYRSTGW